MRRAPRESGQALPLVALVGGFILCAGLAMFTVGRAHAAKGQAQNAADLAALSAARGLADLLPRIAADPDRDREAWRARVATVAGRVAEGNGARVVRLVWPEGSRWPPTAVQVTVAVPGPVGTSLRASARAAITPGVGALPDVAAGGGGQYGGPLAYRDGKPMCPAVAAAFDRMDAAAHGAGIDLVVNSGFRTDAEQAVLFARHPDPRWVARPGASRHRNATELDIAGTPGAWDWLAGNATRFGFTQRYSWEPWHYGYLPGCGSAEPAPDPVPVSGGVDLPAWVPGAYRTPVIAAAGEGGVPPVVLAALLRAESGFDRWAVSPAGARGIAQLMPATARGLGVRDPFDPAAAIPAAARLLGSHVRAFGTIPLALAAYNAGPDAVRRFGGIPPYAETRAYVARIMALAGDPTMAPAAGGGGGGVMLVRIGDLLV